MSVLILNAMSESCDKVLNLQEEICKKEKDSEVVYTQSMNISHCIGCNYCWLKTPGICTIKDDYEKILRKILQYDKIILVTDTKFGFVSHDTKKLVDRMMPLVTMYLQFVDGQMRHIKRYDIQPKLGIIYKGDAKKEYLNRWLSRTALNFAGSSLGAYPVEEGKEILSCI